MLGETLVQEGVVRLQQIEHVAILAHDALEKQLGFLPESLSQIIVEIREQAHIGSHRRQVAQV